MYLTHKDLSKYWLIDIETDGLSPTVIWCIVCKNIGTKETKRFTSDVLDKCLALSNFPSFVRSQEECRWVGHNAVSFDIPVINHLLSCNIRLDNVIDTLVLSYLYYPRQPGGHSLESWGERFGFPKGVCTDFSKFTIDMLEYCIRDVELTELLFLRLTKRMRDRGFSERSCRLEHDIRQVIDQQQRNGFFFDILGATHLLGKLKQEQCRLGLEIGEIFPPVLTAVGEYDLRLKRDGTPTASYLRHCESYPEVRTSGSRYSVWGWKSFNINSPPQRLQKLLELGYTPTKRTKGGGLSSDEEVLVEAAEQLSVPEIQAMADWLVLQGRISMLKGNPDHPTKPTHGWIDYYNPETGAIHGAIASCGAATRRMTHWAPNTANIPKAKPKVKYGREMRSLWTARPNRVLVGYDAAALEMRMFCHYLNNPDVTKLYLEGDPHAYNARVLSDNPWGFVADRDTGAKNGYYAFIYGAQDPKLGSTLDPRGGKDYGLWARNKLFEKTPGLKKLVEEVQDEYYGNDGWISCIDGGLVRCPSPHAAINYKFQSAGGLVMKQASIFLDRKIYERGFDCLKVGDIHDEGQLDCLPAEAPAIGECAVQCIKRAGEELGFHLPLDGTFKVGATWADTH